VYKRQSVSIIIVCLIVIGIFGVVGFVQRVPAKHTRQSQRSDLKTVEQKASEVDIMRNRETLAKAKLGAPDATTPWHIFVDRNACADIETKATYQRIADAIHKNRTVPEDRWTFFSAVNHPPEWTIRDWSGVLNRVERLEDGGFVATVMVSPVFAANPYGNTTSFVWSYCEEYYIGVDGNAVYRRSLDPMERAGMEPGIVLIGG
jgi:hypothetical protein